MLDGHIQSSIPNEGSVSVPIVLADTTAESFANFLKWLYLEYVPTITQIACHAHIFSSPLTPTTMSRAQLIDVLAISHRWIIPNGIDYAVTKLADLSLSAAFQFHLLRQYDIAEWVPCVTRALVLTDLDKLTGPDVAFLGVTVLYTTQKWREKIIFHRMKVGRRIPWPDKQQPDAPFCAQHMTCYKDWHEVWIAHVQSRVLGPPGAFPLTSCIEYVRTLPHLRMGAECKEHLLTWLGTLPMLLKEEEYVSRAVEEIQVLLQI